jgi:penicillin-binding protein 2
MLEAFRRRMFFIMGTMAAVFIILLGQIVNLQLIQGETYKERSRMNMENYIPIPASRGEMYDRNFKIGQHKMVIVSNRPSFNITTIPASVKRK